MWHLPSPVLARDAAAGGGRYPSCRYQATVWRVPVGRSVGAVKPSSRAALETSYIRLCVRKSSLLRVSGTRCLRRGREPVTERGHRPGGGHGYPARRQPGAFRRRRSARARSPIGTGSLPATWKHSPMAALWLPAADQRLRHVVDVDRMQPGFAAADGPETMAHGSTGRTGADGCPRARTPAPGLAMTTGKPQSATGAGPRPRRPPSPARRRSSAATARPRRPGGHRSPRGPLWCCSRRTAPDPALSRSSRAAAWCPVTCVRRYSLGRDARHQQRSGEVVDDLHAVHRGADRGLVGDVADDDVRAHAPRAASALAGDRASTRTCAPSASRRRARLDPRKPVPPVTSAVPFWVPGPRTVAAGRVMPATPGAVRGASPTAACDAGHVGRDLPDRGPVRQHVRVGGVRQRAVAFADLDAAPQFVGLRGAPDGAEVVVVVAQVPHGLGS